MLIFYSHTELDGRQSDPFSEKKKSQKKETLKIGVNLLAYYFPKKIMNTETIN
jgi:hypothetical protein